MVGLGGNARQGRDINADGSVNVEFDLASAASKAFIWNGSYTLLISLKEGPLAKPMAFLRMEALWSVGLVRHVTLKRSDGLKQPG